MLNKEKKIINNFTKIINNFFVNLVNFTNQTKFKLNNLYNVNHNIAISFIKENKLLSANFRLFIMEILWPKNLDIKYMHVMCYILMSMYKQAFSKITKILQIDPNYEPAKIILQKVQDFEDLDLYAKQYQENLTLIKINISNDNAEKK